MMSDFTVDEYGRDDLPSTVTCLNGPFGSKVYLVGTAHFSKESQDDVALTIEKTMPDVVMVELCKSRIAVLQLDEETILQESKSLDFSKVKMILRQHGKVQGILYLLLLSVSAHITKQLGMAPGGEFRTAFTVARKTVPNCLIQLGDRPIHITLSRALAALSVWHKAKLLFHILLSKEPISKQDVEKCKQKDFLEEMLAELTGEFPFITEVFVKERDIYLAKSLEMSTLGKRAASLPNGAKPRVVVGVVGIGHVAGITKHWGKISDTDIEAIMVIPQPPLHEKILKFAFKASLYGIIGLGAYKCLPSYMRTSISSSLRSSLTSLAKGTLLLKLTGRSTHS